MSRFRSNHEKEKYDNALKKALEGDHSELKSVLSPTPDYTLFLRFENTVKHIVNHTDQLDIPANLEHLISTYIGIVNDAVYIVQANRYAFYMKYNFQETDMKTTLVAQIYTMIENLTSELLNIEWHEHFHEITILDPSKDKLRYNELETLLSHDIERFTTAFNKYSSIIKKLHKITKSVPETAVNTFISGISHADAQVCKHLYCEAFKLMKEESNSNLMELIQLEKSRYNFKSPFAKRKREFCPKTKINIPFQDEIYLPKFLEFQKRDSDSDDESSYSSSEEDSD